MLRARLDVADIKQSPEPVLFSEQDGEELSGADNQTQVSKQQDESFYYRDKILSTCRTAPQSWSEYTTDEQSRKS